MQTWRRSHIFLAQVPATLILYIAPTLFTLAILSCSGNVCGDIWDRSPIQLMNENQYVMLARLDGVDTLMELGTYDYLGTESEFLLIDYSFTAAQSLRSLGDSTPRHLWNCERRTASYYTAPAFRIGDTVLVYGNRVTTGDELFLVLSAITPEEDLRSILKGNSPQLDWNTRAIDSMLAVAISNAVYLKERFVDMEQRSEVVIVCQEDFCLTMKDFYKGKLCYYDSLGLGRQVSSSEYLRTLMDLVPK